VLFETESCADALFIIVINAMRKMEMLLIIFKILSKRILRHLQVCHF
jgi:hypothetical protein